MEEQLHRPTTHDHHNINVPSQSVAEGEGEADHNDHGEKKSVLKKVKDKAKKIKDKIKHSGHAHDEEDYDDDDEETVVASSAPDVHAAPIKEDDFISGTNLPKQTGLNLENQTTPVENPSAIGNVVATDPNVRSEGIGNDPVFCQTTPLEDLQNPSETGNVGVMASNVRNEPVPKISSSMEEPYNPSITREQPYSAVGSGSEKMGRSPLYTPHTDLLDPLPTSTAAIDSEPRANVAEPAVKIGTPTDLEKDPHSPGEISPSNYQTKVVDPTGKGGVEAEVAPLVERLGNMHVDDKSEKSYTGSHDHFAPDPISEKFNLEPDTQPKSFDAERPESMPQDTVTGKITAVTSVIADKASSAKNVVASKLGYGSQEGQVSSKPTALQSVSEYGHKVAEKLGSVYGKAAGAGSAEVEGEGVVGKESDKGISVQQYLAEKFSPGDEDKELSKVITDAIHRKKNERGEDEVKETGKEEDCVKESVRIEAIARNEKEAAGVVDRVKGAIGSWLGKNQAGEGLEKAEVSRLQETTGN